MKKTLRGLGVLGVTAILVATACGDDTGGGSATSSGSGGSAARTFGTGGCDACVEAACKAEISSCKADAGCAAWVACLDACPIGANGDADAACESACPVDGSVASDGRDAIVACRRTGPGSACAECGASPSGSTSSGGPEVCTLPAIVEQTCQPAEISDPCIRCVQEECCDSYREVFSSGPTADLADCWLNCASDDVQCAEDCYADNPEGVPGFGNYRACVAAKCNATGICVSDRVNDCVVCQREECTCESASCYADVECHLTYECFANCTDEACIARCTAAHPDGAALFDNLAICSGQNCVQRCGTG